MEILCLAVRTGEEATWRPDSSDREDETQGCSWQQQGVQCGSVEAAGEVLFSFDDAAQSRHWPRTRDMNNMHPWECPRLHLTNIMGPLLGQEPCGTGNLTDNKMAKSPAFVGPIFCLVSSKELGHEKSGQDSSGTLPMCPVHPSSRVSSFLVEALCRCPLTSCIFQCVLPREKGFKM